MKTIVRYLFVSQPMSGLAHEDILAERDRAAEQARETLEALNPGTVFDVRVLPSYNSEPGNWNDIELLGDAVTMMGMAECICFANGWKSSRGCKVEHLVAELYKIPILFE